MTSRSERLAALLALAVLATPAIAAAQEPPPAEADPLERQRERFKLGMERYRADAFGEAILVWSEIYRELGPEKGYRLAFNLARAYEKVNDAPRAAEHYDSYLAQVRKRREAEEEIEPLVAKQEEEAQQRIGELRSKLGQIHFRGPEVLVVIDADVPRVGRNVAYVTAGKHAIKYRPSTADERRVEVEVAAGQVVEIEPPPIEAPPPPAVVVPPPSLPPAIRWETHEEHPYPRSLLYIGGGATVISLVLPVMFYSFAGGYRDEYNLANGVSEAQAQRAATDYEGARSAAYASWAIPALLGATTAALTAYWYFGKKTVRTPMSAVLTF